MANSQGASVFTEAEQKLLEDHQGAIHSLEAERDELLAKLERKNRSIIEAQRKYGNVYNSKSLLKKLPNEIVATIFNIAQDDNRINGAPQGPIAEVIISHVCSHWRQLALSIPTLWNVFRYQAQCTSAVPAARLAAYLERSQRVSLDLWFDFTDGGNMKLSQWPQQLAMLRLVIPHVPRCRRLHILSDSRACDIYEIYRDLKDAPAALLEVFAFRPDRYHTTPEIEDLDEFERTISEWIPNIFLSGAPSLAYVLLDSTSVLSIRPPLDSLRHLRLEICEFSTPFHFSCSVLDYILTLPLLESLSVTYEFFRLLPDDFPRLSTIEAGSLKHFRYHADAVVDSSTSVLMYFLCNVSAPLLETLTFGWIRFQPDVFLPTTRAEYFFPSLRIFTILRSEMGPENVTTHHDSFVRQLLRLTRKTKHFILSLSQPGCNLFNQIAAAVGTEDIWGDLEEFTLTLPLITPPLYVAFTNAWPNLLVWNKPQLSMDAMAQTGAHLPERPVLKAIDVNDPLTPLYWPPGFDRMDNDEDPLHCYSAWVTEDDD